MRRIGSLVGRRWVDTVIALAAVEVALEVAFRHDVQLEPQTTPWFGAPAIAFLVLALLARRRLPFAAPAALWLYAAALSFADPRLVVFAVGAQVAGLGASFLLGNLRDAAQARVGLAIAIGCAAIVEYNDPKHSAGGLIFIPALFAIAWLAGYALRERAAQAEAAEERAILAERERETAARIAVAEERARIARELHDIVAHAVSVMVLQVGAVRHKLPGELAEDTEALENVERTGRTALAEMRRLLGAMRRENDELELTPHPGLDRLEALIAEVGDAGLPVALHVEGEAAPLPTAIDLSAYRIVQEGLTNALKHAHATQADVLIRYGPRDLTIEVRDDGSGGSAGDGLGHGLVGVRERVKIYGGEMSAGSANGGGFLLSTRLPLSGDRP